VAAAARGPRRRAAGFGSAGCVGSGSGSSVGSVG